MISLSDQIFHSAHKKTKYETELTLCHG